MRQGFRRPDYSFLLFQLSLTHRHHSLSLVVFYTHEGERKKKKKGKLRQKQKENLLWKMTDQRTNFDVTSAAAAFASRCHRLLFWGRVGLVGSDLFTAPSSTTEPPPSAPLGPGPSIPCISKPRQTHPRQSQHRPQRSASQRHVLLPACPCIAPQNPQNGSNKTRYGSSPKATRVRGVAPQDEAS